jgi:hypothetical protein
VDNDFQGIKKGRYDFLRGKLIKRWTATGLPEPYSPLKFSYDTSVGFIEGYEPSNTQPRHYMHSNQYAIILMIL